MNRYLRRIRSALFLAGFALVAMAIGSAYRPTGFVPAPQLDVVKVQSLLAQVASSSLDAQQKTEGCAVAGPLPDHACTPGAVFADASTTAICTPGYSASVRSVSVSLKKKIYAAYGIAYPEPPGSYEMDHLVPLELGGSNEAANLFPEAAQPTPGFKEKDVVEDYLHDEVCAGQLSLAAAQVQIATNWVAVYDALSPATIASIKQKYQSWAK